MNTAVVIFDICEEIIAEQYKVIHSLGAEMRRRLIERFESRGINIYSPRREYVESKELLLALDRLEERVVGTMILPLRLDIVNKE